jgi:aspartyl-tRNA(Asn)/glutamyl-tRNA(Gln) amidotransferase subunit B
VSAAASKYEIVVGVEVHAQLATRTKLFCGCSTAFGRPPNTQTCPVCLGLPGVLPVTNKRAFELAILTALALQCEIAKKTRFDRKNYYYPDLPKNYQISQSYLPLGTGGRLALSSGKEVRIENVHIEEDAGKLLHELPGGSVVDLNRAGIPLVEIVSGPDMRSLEEVEDYMESLRLTLLHLGVSECKMQEGDLRFEASISLRPRGETQLGARVEVKNLNSTKNVLAALAFEAERQAEILDRGEKVARETRLFDAETGETARMRSKEEAHDYRYFPEPDLPPIEVSETWLENLRARLGELPNARRARYVAAIGLTPYEAGVLVEEPRLCGYFDALAARTGDAKAAANWLLNDVLARLNERKATIESFEAAVPPDALAELIDLVRRDVVSGQAARLQVLPAMMETRARAADIIRERGLAQESDRAALTAIVEKTLDTNPRIVEDWKKGKQQVLGFLVGQCMRASGGKGNPKLFQEILREALGRR